jgi:hypothetical protein
MNIKSRISRLEELVPPAKNTTPLTLKDWTLEERSIAIDLLINEVRPWPEELQQKSELTDFGPLDSLNPKERRSRINKLLI